MGVVVAPFLVRPSLCLMSQFFLSRFLLSQFFFAVSLVPSLYAGPVFCYSHSFRSLHDTLKTVFFSSRHIFLILVCFFQVELFFFIAGKCFSCILPLLPQSQPPDLQPYRSGHEEREGWKLTKRTTKKQRRRARLRKWAVGPPATACRRVASCRVVPCSVPGRVI